MKHFGSSTKQLLTMDLDIMEILKCEPEAIVKFEPLFTENSYDITVNNDNLVKTECEAVSCSSSNYGSLNDDIIKQECKCSFSMRKQVATFLPSASDKLTFKEESPTPLAASEHNQESTGNLMSIKHSASCIQTGKAKTLTKTRHSCPNCSRNFTRRESFNIHLRRRHSKKNPDFLAEKFDKTYFTYDISKFKSSCSSSLKSHMHEKFDDNKIFKCTDCDYECYGKSAIRVHIQSKHSNDRPTHSCTFCNKTLFNKKSLADHLLSHHDDKFDKSLKTLLGQSIKHCKLCDFRTNLKHKLNQHMTKHGTDIIMFKCNYCDHEACNKSNLGAHIQRKHSNDRPAFSCRFCNKSLSCKASLRGHIQRIHSNYRHTYSCRFCNKLLYRKNSLVDHLLCHHGEKFEKSLKKLLSLDIKHCNLCDFRVHRKSMLIHHIQSKHSNGRSSYTCRFCHKSFFYKDCLADHLLRLHGDKFDKSLKKLLSHTIKHCKLCDFRTTVKARLNQHMVKHDHSLVKADTDAIIFKCNNCYYETLRKGSLRAHIQHKHSNGRPAYSCTFCNKAWSIKTSLADHLLTSHGDEFDKSLKTLFSLTIKYCKLCDFRSTTTTRINRHMTKHDHIIKQDKK